MGELAESLRRLAGLGVEASDSDEIRVSKGTFVIFGIAAGLAGAAWTILYLALGGRPLAASIPGAFTVVDVGVLIFYARTRWIGRLPDLQMLLMLLLPALLQLSLGGFVKGSAVVVWAFAAPMLALLYHRPRGAAPWFVGFGAVVVVCVLLNGFASDLAPELPERTRIVLFALNILGIASLTFVTLAYFRRGRDEAAERSDRLLLNVLPREIAARLKKGENPIVDSLEEITVLFADMTGFTTRSIDEHPAETVKVLNEVFSAFDELADRHGMLRIRTSGDNYMAVAGVPLPRKDHARAAVDLALAMQAEVDRLNAERGWHLAFRIGLNCGPAVAAVIGSRKFTYDVWSDAVNTASRMESHGEPGRIHVTAAIAARLGDGYMLIPRGGIEVKGKGTMETFFVESAALNGNAPRHQPTTITQAG
ncbi:MAG: adenylate/guanylate cyclase domain-containing protein [Chloroflexi bacterium]|nr:MAG: adenylate/guanylate cyclase domain-containing protein [Chloroflexota bacterium]